MQSFQNLILSCKTRWHGRFSQNVCALLEKHRRFMGCDNGNDWMEKQMPGLVERFDCDLVNESDLESEEDLTAYRKALSGEKCRRLKQ